MAVPIVIYKDKPKQHSWARWMVARTMRKNQNNLISFVGKTGSGKTWSALSIAEIMSKLDKTLFGIENIVFSLRELMELINSGNLKKGSKIVFDEPQVSISAREFQSEANKVFNYLLSTFRHRNLSLFFCTPYESLLDKNTRRLFHARFETSGVNLNNKTCRLKPRYVEYSDYSDKVYRKRLKVIVEKEGDYAEINLLDYWDVPKPSQDLIDKYEQKKREFTDRLNKNIQARLQKYDESGKSLTGIKKEIEKRKIQCDKCGYEWESASMLMRVNCPSCNGKVSYKTPHTRTKLSCEVRN